MSATNKSWTDGRTDGWMDRRLQLATAAGEGNKKTKFNLVVANKNGNGGG
jgi:hypothetical protein